MNEPTIVRTVQTEGTYTLTPNDVAAYLHQFYDGKCGCGGTFAGRPSAAVKGSRTGQCVWCSATQVANYLRKGV